MVDDYAADELARQLEGFQHASRTLDWERRQGPEGDINMERLMTRLDGMPYDFDQGAHDELGILSSYVMKQLIRRLVSIREKRGHAFELEAFARYRIQNEFTCITFNYDDILDEALWGLSREVDQFSGTPRWHPDGGYGFFCRPSELTVRDTVVFMDKMSMLLLKLHGSINWRARRGYTRPYVIDAIVHDEPWFTVEPTVDAGGNVVPLHLEPDPFMIPPVLLKGALVEQPVLRLVWHRAYQALARAQQVTFVGYSLPATDIAATVLFDESLKDLPKANIAVVNPAGGETERRQIRSAYRRMLGDIPDKQFDFRGALDWSKELVA